MMNYDAIYKIASRGLEIEKLRVDVVANNMANQHTLNNSDGTRFQPMHVLATAPAFDSFLEATDDDFLTQVTLVPSQQPPNKVYQPTHQDADAQGYVSYPGISTVDEMTTLLQATRSYEANLTILTTAHSLYRQALTIGEER